MATSDRAADVCIYAGLNGSAQIYLVNDRIEINVALDGRPDYAYAKRRWPCCHYPRLGNNVDGNRRIAGPAVDQGAFENTSVPGSLETPYCTAARPGRSLPLWMPICLCSSDRSIRDFRCRLSHLDLALELRVTLPFEVGRFLGLEWVAFPHRRIEDLGLEVELPKGLAVVNQKLSHVIKLGARPGGPARAKLGVETVESAKVYEIGAPLTAAAHPDEPPIHPEFRLPVNPALPEDDPTQSKPTGGPFRQKPESSS